MPRVKICSIVPGSMEQTQTNLRAALGSIVVVSAAAVSFLLWLLYLHQAPTQFAGKYVFLPALNAIFNGLSAIALCTGLYFIKKRDRKAHRATMLLAFGFSSLFLVIYIVNHAPYHARRAPAGNATIRAIYLAILASHIILSVVALPLVLIT